MKKWFHDTARNLLTGIAGGLSVLLFSQKADTFSYVTMIVCLLFLAGMAYVESKKAD